MEQATFAAGCFWGIEEAFRQVKGVMKTSVGFMGGHTENPSYKDVCYTDTGHAEVVQVEFDPAVVSYDELLSLFWQVHDPTQLNRQGPDVGTQYRSAIFTHTPEQAAAAQASKERLQASPPYADRPIVTRIEPAGPYYLAEDYHQQYVQKQGRSCSLW